MTHLGASINKMYLGCHSNHFGLDELHHFDSWTWFCKPGEYIMVFPNPNNKISRRLPLYRFPMYDVTFMDYNFCFPFKSREHHSLLSMVFSLLWFPPSWNYIYSFQHLCTRLQIRPQTVVLWAIFQIIWEFTYSNHGLITFTLSFPIFKYLA